MKEHGKKHENLPGNLCSMLLIMHGIDSYSARSKCHVRIFTVPPDFGGLAAGLEIDHTKVVVVNSNMHKFRV